MDICKHCNCRLRPFTKTNDWAKRSLHKTCYFHLHKTIDHNTYMLSISNDDPELSHLYVKVLNECYRLLKC